MKVKSFFCYFFSLCLIYTSQIHSQIHSQIEFLVDYKQLEAFDTEKTIMIASPGRSGSTLLTMVLDTKLSTKGYTILKTHLLPPSKDVHMVKTIFIFSRPDNAAESALHMTINSDWWGALHFKNVGSSDSNWLTKIGDTTNQTLADNLLSYDALGCGKQLLHWIYGLQTCSKNEAQVLAIKYERLWDTTTVQAIREFLGVDDFQLPPKQERGNKETDQREILFKQTYNLGTAEYPQYQAYDSARHLWRISPSITYLKLN